MIDAHKNGRRAARCGVTRTEIDNQAMAIYDTAEEREALIAGYLGELKRIDNQEN